MSKTSRVERGVQHMGFIPGDIANINIHPKQIKSHRQEIQNKLDILLETSFSRGDDIFFEKEPIMTAINTGKGSIKFSLNQHQRSTSINIIQRRGRKIQQENNNHIDLVHQENSALEKTRSSFGNKSSLNMFPKKMDKKQERNASLSFSKKHKSENNTTYKNLDFLHTSRPEWNKTPIFLKTMLIRKRNKSSSTERWNEDNPNKHSIESSFATAEKKRILPSLQPSTARGYDSKTFSDLVLNSQRSSAVFDKFSQFKKVNPPGSPEHVTIRSHRDRVFSKNKVFENMIVPALASISEVGKSPVRKVQKEEDYSFMDLESEAASPCVTNREPVSNVAVGKTVRLRSEDFDRIQLHNIMSQNIGTIFDFEQLPKKETAPVEKTKPKKQPKSREILILDSDFRRHYKCLITKMTIPNYERVYDKELLEQDYLTFLESLNQQFPNKKRYRQLFLLNGEPIMNLYEIPSSCGLVLASNSIAGCNFRTKYFEYHNMEVFPADKWNLLMHLLNIQTEEFKVIYLLTSQDFYNSVICNSSLQFDMLLEAKNMIHMKKNIAVPEVKHSHDVKKILHIVDNIYGDDYFTLDPETRREEAMKNYNRSLNRMNDKFKFESDPIQYKKAQIIEELLRGVNIFLHDRDRRYQYINALDELIPKTKRAQDIEPDDPLFLKSKRELSEDYITNNIKNVKTDYKKLREIIDKENPPLFHLNIPKLQSESDFSRRELHKLYCKYKALCALYAVGKKDKKAYSKALFIFELIEKDPKYGFDKETFKQGFSQFKLSTDNVVHKVVFGSGHLGNKTIILAYNLIEREENITWPKFLRVMMSLRAKSAKDKIGFFLRLLASNGSEALSYVEIEALCRSALKPFQNGDNDEIVVSLVEYFTRSVFQTCEIDQKASIPIEKLIQIVEQGMGAIDLLLELSGAERAQAEENALLDDGLIDKKMPHLGL